MAINSQSIFATAERLVNEAVKSAGTSVQFDVVKTETLDDLTTVETVVESLYSSPGIVTTTGSGSGISAPEILPGVILRPTDWRIVLPAKTSDVPEHARVTITKCRDTKLTGQTARVLGAVRNSTGAVHFVFARPGAPQ